MFIATAIGLCCCAEAIARKPVTTRFSVVELPIEGTPIALSERDASSRVTVCLSSSEAGYESAAFAKVDATSGTTIASGFLPEPPFVDPNDGVMKNGPSASSDVNRFGKIVGYALTYDPEASDDPPSRAILWTDKGSGYAYTLLPLPAGATWSRAMGINNWGDIVGMAGQGIGYGVAVIWVAGEPEPFDLNTAATAALGWQLLGAQDINDAGLVVGMGRLDGVFRGYMLDVTTGDIWPVPLVDPETGNYACRINEVGRVIGDAWDGEGRPWNPDPDYYHAYSWNGPGTDPVALPSLTLNTSAALGLNDFGATVGFSVIPSDDPGDNEKVCTLWEFDDQGNVLATDIQEEISTKHTLFSCHVVNNDGWIGAHGRKFVKGHYQWRALLLVPIHHDAAVLARHPRIAEPGVARLAAPHGMRKAVKWTVELLGWTLATIQ